MQEIEVKILEINKEELIKKLENLWAEMIFDSYIDAEFFMSQNQKKLRLRKTKYWNYMTMKEKIQKDWYKINQEHELEFGDYETFEKILILSWFQKFWISKKQRISYKLWNIVFDFDSIKDIPDFVEVESDNIADVEKWVEILGYNMSQTNTFWEKELKEFYWIKWGI